MTKTPSGRGRRSTYDRAAIARLLVERAASGESYAALSARSGIPAGTLAWHANRRSRVERSGRSPFVEIVRAEVAEHKPETETALRILIDTSRDTREIVVPRGFDADELQRVIAALEPPC